MWREGQKKKPLRIAERKNMLTHSAYAKNVAIFMQKTGLLKQFVGIFGIYSGTVRCGGMRWIDST